MTVNCNDSVEESERQRAAEMTVGCSDSEREDERHVAAAVTMEERM